MIQHEFPSADILFEFRRCELPYHAQGVGDYVILDCLADVSGANQSTLSEIRSSVHVLKKILDDGHSGRQPFLERLAIVGGVYFVGCMHLGKSLLECCKHIRIQGLQRKRHFAGNK